MTGRFFYGVSLLASHPTPFSRLLRQAEDTMDLFYPRSIGVSVCNTFLQLAVIGRKSGNFINQLMWSPQDFHILTYLKSSRDS